MAKTAKKRAKSPTQERASKPATRKKVTRKGNSITLTPAQLRHVTERTMLGATDAELADWLGISPKSVQRLKQRDPAFKAAVLAGGREANANVVYAGYRRAVGMRVVEQKAVVCNGEITIVDLEREIPPDTGAVFKWLHNRERDAWGDGGDGGRLDSLLDLMTMLREYARRHGQAAAAEIAKHHGYSGVLVDGEAEDVSAD